MTLINRIKFAFKYDFDHEFRVFNSENRNPSIFLEYKNAKKHSDSQIQYRPKIFVEVRLRSNK